MSSPEPDLSEQPSGGPARRPAALLAVVVAVIVESLVMLVVAGVYLGDLVSEGSQDPVPAVLTVVVALAVCAGLLTAVRGLLRGRRWARAPVVTWQLLQTAVVLPALGTSLRAGAVALVVLAVVAVGGLFAPSVVQATNDGAAPPLL